MFDLQEFGKSMYLIPKTGGMKVPGLLVANATLLKELEIEQPLEQVRNVAHLQGITGYSIAMPDIHWGYGFPIGGVAATDAEEGVISPGGVGYDINCGVRLAILPIKYSELDERQQRRLLQELYRLIPSGVGQGTKQDKLTEQDYRELIAKGSRWSIEKGFGLEQDLECTESHGLIAGGNCRWVSDLAKNRGASQLGSIGSGNHFVEIGLVERLLLPETAAAWGIHEGQIYLLIHSGSRGFGHQICQDTLNAFIQDGYAKGLPDKQLVAAPIKSPAGQKYISVMAAAANFAFNNRQRILHQARQAIQNVLGIAPEEVRLIYDVCHNIAKFEEYQVDNKLKTLCVHRKGATRAYGPGHKELNSLYRKTGQPVLVPGDMGRASYLMVGLGNPITWCSACHGAGRAKSRIKSMKDWGGRDLITHMHKQGVLVMAESSKTIAEEMPDAYKNVEDVVQAVQEAGLANMVARLKPRMVIKG